MSEGTPVCGKAVGHAAALGRRAKVVIALVLSAAALVFAGPAGTDPASAATPSWTITPLGAPTERAKNARVSIEAGVVRVVWDAEDPATGQSHIYLYDSGVILGSKIICVDQVAGAGTSYNVFPDYKDGVVVWQGRASATEDYEIYAYYLDARYFGSGSSLTRVTTNAVDDTMPRTDGGKIVWQRYDGHDSEIQMYYHVRTILGGIETIMGLQLTDNDCQDLNPDISTYESGLGTVTAVVFTSYMTGDDGDIWEWYAPLDYPKSPLDGVYQVLTFNDQPEVTPSVGEAGVCWATYDGSDWEIYWSPGAGSSPDDTLQITNNSSHEMFPDIDDGPMVWRAWAVGQSGPASAVTWYDPATGQTANVSDDRHPAFSSPTISGSVVAYEFSSDSGAHSDVGLASPLAAPVGFTDIAGSPYADAIVELAGLGIISGYPDGTFRPNNPVLRKHFAKMIVGSIGLTVSEDDWQDANPPFTDCGPDDPTSTYPHDFIAVAKSSRLTTGKTGTTFAPDANITRAQLITMVVRAAQEYRPPLKPVGADYAGTFRNYADPTHGSNVRLAEYNGFLEGLVVSGDPSAWLRGNATRGEVALVLVRFQAAAPPLVIF